MKFIFIISSLLCLFSCSTKQIRGSGNLKSETRNVSGFNKIVLSTSIDLQITQTGTESLIIEAEDNILPLLTSTISGDTLTLGTKKGTNFSTTKPSIYKLTVNNLEALELSESANVTATNIDSTKMDITLSGSGNIKFSGKTTQQYINISGSGNYSAFDLESDNTKIVLSGSGDVFVNVKENLDIDLSSSGSIEYKGRPRIIQKVSGSGSIISR